MLQNAKYKVYHSSEIPMVGAEDTPTYKAQPKPQAKKHSFGAIFFGYLLHQLGTLLGL